MVPKDTSLGFQIDEYVLGYFSIYHLCIKAIDYLVNNYLLNNLLIQQTNKYVKKKIELSTYQGKRHNLGYPVRGQRTLSNGKTQRNLHKFRFYYNADLFNHSFFKNKRKSSKNKKIAKLKSKKKKKRKKNSITEAITS